jgi:two-component system response regulator DctR
VVLDVRMEGMSGTEMFDELIGRGCDLPVISLTGHGDVPLTVGALKKGAFDFVEKPFNDNDLVDRVLEAIRQHESRTQTRHDPQPSKKSVQSVSGTGRRGAGGGSGWGIDASRAAV